MKKLLKRLLIKLLNPINKRLGFKRHHQFVNPYAKNTLLEGLFNNFKTMGFEPKHIIDVGANHGTWTREVLKFVPGAYFTLVEPQNWLRFSFEDLLKGNSKISYLPVGAGKNSGCFKFTIVDRDDSCSFKYSEEEAIARGFEQVEIPVITLNEIVNNNSNIPFPDLVKIDAEGLDIEVLEGAADLFGKTEVFMVEVAVFSKSFDNTCQKMINYMADKGYMLFDITDLNRPFKPNVLWLMELVFIRKDGIINNYQVV
jgi:FkbM family methyltransferase